MILGIDTIKIVTDGKGFLIICTALQIKLAGIGLRIIQVKLTTVHLEIKPSDLSFIPSIHKLWSLHSS